MDNNANQTSNFVISISNFSNFVIMTLDDLWFLRKNGTNSLQQPETDLRAKMCHSKAEPCLNSPESLLTPEFKSSTCNACKSFSTKSGSVSA